MSNNTEIEIKWLLNTVPNEATYIRNISQWYIDEEPETRVRKSVYGEYSVWELTTKTSFTFTRLEHNVIISQRIAQTLITSDLLLYPPIEKNRYAMYIGRHIAEIDQFENGPILLEVEFASNLEYDDFIKSQPFQNFKHRYCTLDVTHDRKYYNLEMAKNGILT